MDFFADPYVPSFLCLYALGLLLATIAHEGAHVGMGWFLRCHPRLLCIGVGKVLFRAPVNGGWLVVRAIPIGGYVLLVPRSRARRVASVWVTGAGPLANILCLAALYAAWPWVPDIVAISFAAGQILLLCYTLPPFKGKIHGVPVSSDGRKVLDFMLGRDIDVLAATYERVAKLMAPDVPAPPPSPEWPEIVFQVSRVDAREPWGRKQAVAELEAVVARGHANAVETAFIETCLEDPTGGLKPGGFWTRTIELWRAAFRGRSTIGPTV